MKSALVFRSLVFISRLLLHSLPYSHKSYIFAKMLNLPRRQALQVCRIASKESLVIIRPVSLSQARHFTKVTPRKNASHQSPSILSNISPQKTSAPNVPTKSEEPKPLLPIPEVKCVVRARSKYTVLLTKLFKVLFKVVSSFSPTLLNGSTASPSLCQHF